MKMMFVSTGAQFMARKESPGTLILTRRSLFGFSFKPFRVLYL